MAVIRRIPQFTEGQKALCIPSGRTVTIRAVRGREIRITYDDMECQIPSCFISDEGFLSLKEHQPCQNN